MCMCCGFILYVVFVVSLVRQMVISVGLPGNIKVIILMMTILNVNKNVESI